MSLLLKVIQDIEQILCYKPLPAIRPFTSIKKTGFINVIKSFLSTVTYK